MNMHTSCYHGMQHFRSSLPNLTSRQLVYCGGPEDDSKFTPINQGGINHAFKYLYFKCTAGLFKHSWHSALFSRPYLSIHVSIVSDNTSKDSHHYLLTFPFFFFWLCKLISNRRLLPTVRATDFKVLWHTKTYVIPYVVTNISHL